MVEQLTDMPEGTLGFRSTGDLTGEDYREVIVPPLRERIDAGEKIRMMFVIGEDFRETPSGIFEDIKAGTQLGAGHMSAWERTAVVSDQGWVRKGVRMFGWMAPGELKVFPLTDEAKAREWLIR